jgi:hypothetical protein
MTGSVHAPIAPSAARAAMDQLAETGVRYRVHWAPWRALVHLAVACRDRTRARDVAEAVTETAARNPELAS